MKLENSNLEEEKKETLMNLANFEVAIGNSSVSIIIISYLTQF